mmetsp:Transcript_19287/g.63829  ORF Transcript_19287/g.63829 Transcript_19287/m.63829 type:complete len:214 (+) Transcript_19287:394-1035(+)
MSAVWSMPRRARRSHGALWPRQVSLFHARMPYDGVLVLSSCRCCWRGGGGRVKFFCCKLVVLILFPHLFSLMHELVTVFVQYDDVFILEVLAQIVSLLPCWRFRALLQVILLPVVGGLIPSRRDLVVTVYASSWPLPLIFNRGPPRRHSALSCRFLPSPAFRCLVMVLSVPFLLCLVQIFFQKDIRMSLSLLLGRARTDGRSKINQIRFCYDG